MMLKLKGRLLYMGWSILPWKLVTDEGEVDLWPFVEDFFISLRGERVSHNREREGYVLSADRSSDFLFDYTPGGIVMLYRVNEFGGSNVIAYLDSTLVWLSGRLIEVEIENGKQLKFTADSSEKVFGVFSTEEGASWREVPSGSEVSVCKVGQGEECCVFLTMSGDGFFCQKFNVPMARIILERLANGEMSARRIGNCALLGRKEKVAD